ncbi:chloroperoxidase [Halalkalibacillus sediminis]|uniref:Chloroperoxidase n=1 Tax=Halalkalibacillus sediminis TaxID=2018042 RepID=A0A2I0QRM9_9BACI|nr:vanadium-dependent haloperoxidase [Halalkalibacillus sediminis]PKR76988.1 chloroperoxidase [Halalkalibacillus sediminis]
MGIEYLKWSQTRSAGERGVPTDPVTPSAGNWPLFFLRRNKEGVFLEPSGEKLKPYIKHPNKINFEEELKVVQRTLDNLSPSQKDIAIYYGTGVPTKQWTPIADRLIDTYDVTPTLAARILANLHGAINDTMVVVWYLKYKWDVARPNQYDQTLETIICTPNFPTYPSGHAAMSGCAEVVLSYYFPREANKLREISETDAVSRLYAGVHFPSDNDEGLSFGRYIGEVIVEYLKNQDRQAHRSDQRKTSYRNADIFPVNFEQFIPFDFPDKCNTLVRSSRYEDDLDEILSHLDLD